MGNHEIDCDYCGKDQRTYGDKCCERYQREKRIAEENRAAEYEVAERFMKTHHPGVWILSGRIDVRDVVRILKDKS